MGSCQGLVCHNLIESALARFSALPDASSPPTIRPPIRPVWLKQLSALAPQFKKPIRVVDSDVLWEEQDKV
jgi:hypothetical protein